MIFWFKLLGKKPRKFNPFDSNPDTEKAEVKAETPGIVIIWWLLFLANFTNSPAGSDIPGVPASVTKATSFVSKIFMKDDVLRFLFGW